MKKLIFALIAVLSLAMPSQVDAKKKDMAFQMYSVREKIGDAGKFAENHVQILGELAKMGYTAIEAANYGDGKFYGMSPENFKAAIEGAGMKVLSSHTTRNLNSNEIKDHNFSDALRWWDQCIDAHKRAGMKYIVIPWSDVPKTISEAVTVCEFYTEVGKRVNAAGMKLGYHNHSHEFQKVEDKVYIDFLLDNIPEDLMFFEMDVYWAVRGGASPVDYFNRYPNRFTLLHIKDNREIGQSGMVGFDAIFNNMEKAGTKNWIVELEGTTSGNIMQGMKESAEYLQKAKFVKGTYEK